MITLESNLEIQANRIERIEKNYFVQIIFFTDSIQSSLGIGQTTFHF